MEINVKKKLKLFSRVKLFLLFLYNNFFLQKKVETKPSKVVYFRAPGALPSPSTKKTKKKSPRKEFLKFTPKKIPNSPVAKSEF